MTDDPEIRDAFDAEQAVLSALMRLERPPGSKSDPLLSRRIDELRCASALTLALAGYDVSGLVSCAEQGSYVQQRAKLKAVATHVPVSTGGRLGVDGGTTPASRRKPRLTPFWSL